MISAISTWLSGSVASICCRMKGVYGISEFDVPFSTFQKADPSLIMPGLPLKELSVIWVCKAANPGGACYASTQSLSVRPCVSNKGLVLVLSPVLVGLNADST